MTTDERMKKMEGQLARLKWISGGLIVGVILCLLTCVMVVLCLVGWYILETSSTETDAEQIRANRFILEDENGKTRAKLSVDWDVPGLYMFDENGKPRAVLHIDKDGPGLSLSDEKGKTSAMLYVGKDGPKLALFGENGKLIWKAP